jgi:hypothetical protein
MLMLLLSIWCGLTWLSWTLIFSSSPQAVLEVPSHHEASPLYRAVFVGQTLSTLGSLDVKAQGPYWQLLSSLCALNGFFLLTLTVTYLLPLFEAAAEKRRTALMISSLGRTPAELLRDKYHEPLFHEELAHIAEALLQQSVNHRAYPVLHLFHASRPKMSLTLQIAMLDEAVTMLECGATPQYRLPRSVYEPLRGAVREFLLTVSHMYKVKSKESPPERPLEELALLLPEVLDARGYSQRVEGYGERRRALKAMLEGHGWDWGHVDRPPGDSSRHEFTGI